MTALAVTWLPLLQETLAKEGRFRFPLRGNSMRPTLPAACEIEIAPPPPVAPLGSLVVFASGDALIAHRLVRRIGSNPPVWVAHGDGRLGPDRPLRPEQLLGIVVAAYLDGRRIWPGPAEKLLRWYWVARHHALRPPRRAWHALRALRQRRRRGNAVERGR